MLGVSQAAIEILNGGEHAIKASQIDAGLGYQCSEGCAVYRKKKEKRDQSMAGCCSAGAKPPGGLGVLRKVATQ